MLKGFGVRILLYTRPPPPPPPPQTPFVVREWRVQVEPFECGGETPRSGAATREGEPVRPSGKVLGCKQDLGSIPLRLSSLFKRSGLCDTVVWLNLPLTTNNETL